MKKLLLTLLGTAALALASCNQSMNAKDIKSRLEGKGYGVQLRDEAKTKEEIMGIDYNVSITDSIWATKGSNEIAILFFCSSFDDADKFIQTNIQAMYNTVSKVTNDPKVGNFNNVAYAATPVAIQDAGLSFN